MKRGLILIPALLLSLNIANAQTEITIFGQNYSIILVAPIFFMALMVLFFFGLIIKDNLGKFKLPKIKISGIKTKQQEAKALKDISLNYRFKYNLLKERYHKIGAEPSFNEFGNIVKEFFKDKFNIKHEFAFAELENIAKDHVKDVDLADRISSLKYSGEKIDTSELKKLFNKFETLLISYETREIKPELGFFGRVGKNFLAVFKRREIKPVKPDLGKLIIKAPLPIPPVEVIKKPEFPLEIKKPGIFSRLFTSFKKKEPENLVKIKEIKKPKEIIHEKSHKIFKFNLFKNIKIRILKSRILSLIKDGMVTVNLNPIIAKRYYARALLDYHKLPLREEKEIFDKLTQLNEAILDKKRNEKTFLDLSKKLIDIKKNGRQVSKEALSIIHTLRNFIQREELLASTRLKEFSHKLKHEERKLGHLTGKKEELFKEDIDKFRHFIRKDERTIGKDLQKVEEGVLGKELPEAPKPNKYYFERLKKEQSIAKRNSFFNRLKRFIRKEERLTVKDVESIGSFAHKEEIALEKGIKNVGENINEFIFGKELPEAPRPNWHYFEEIKKEKLNAKRNSFFNRLKRFLSKEEKIIGRNVKSLEKREEEFIKNEKLKIKHFFKSEEHVLREKFKSKPEIIKNEGIKQKTIHLVDQYNPKLSFKHEPHFENIPHPKTKVKEEYVKKQPRQIRILQKERNDLYNKLLELEDGKLTHHKVN